MRPTFLLGGLALLLACSQEKPASSPTASAVPPTAPPTVGWPAAFKPAADQPCARTATRSATIYARPQADGAVFGQLAAGERVLLQARTADGWVGFDPATAQAANVGVFRLRWVRAAEVFGPADSCAQLPVVALPSGCLLMAARALPVWAAPRPDAALLDSLPAGSYARVLPAAGTDGWLPVAVPGRPQPGYVAAADASLNGPCR